MTNVAKERSKHGSTLYALSEEDLPPQYNRRWTPTMKAKVVAAVETGLISATEAKARYALSNEELTSWQRGFAQRGVKGLTIVAGCEHRRERLTGIPTL